MFPKLELTVSVALPGVVFGFKVRDTQGDMGMFGDALGYIGMS